MEEIRHTMILIRMFHTYTYDQLEMYFPALDESYEKIVHDELTVIQLESLIINYGKVLEHCLNITHTPNDELKEYIQVIHERIKKFADLLPKIGNS